MSVGFRIWWGNIGFRRCFRFTGQIGSHRLHLLLDGSEFLLNEAGLNFVWIECRSFVEVDSGRLETLGCALGRGNVSFVNENGSVDCL